MNNWKSSNVKQFIASKKCQSARRFVHWFIKQPRYQINFYCIFLMISLSNNFPLYIFCECFFQMNNWKSRNARQFTWFSTDIGELDAQQLRILVKKSTINNKGSSKTLLIEKCFQVMSLNLQFSLMHCSGVFFEMFLLIICHKLIYKKSLHYFSVLLWMWSFILKECVSNGWRHVGDRHAIYVLYST